MSGHDHTYEPDNFDQRQQTGLVRVQDLSTGEEREIQPFTDDPKMEPLALRDSTFKGTGGKPVTKAQDRILRKPLDPKTEVDILPTGEVYVSHVHIRRRLNEAFGPMGWALRPLGNVAYDPTARDMYREWALIANGRVVAAAFGSAKYQPTNKRMDFADAAEAVKSNALTRCAKDLGIASECWDRAWTEKWKNDHAVHVYVIEKVWNRKRGADSREDPKQVDKWRKIDAPPFHKEKEPVGDSPNQEKWRQQMTAWIALLDTEVKKTREVADKIAKIRKDAADAIEQSERAVREARREADREAPRTNAGQTQAPVTHGRPNGDDRRFLVRDCKPVDRQATYTLYKITFMNGDEFFTFSSTTFASFQMHMARRDVVEITSIDAKRIGDRTYRHIVEWKVLRQGQQQP